MTRVKWSSVSLNDATVALLKFYCENQILFNVILSGSFKGHCIRRF